MKSPKLVIWFFFVVVAAIIAVSYVYLAPLYKTGLPWIDAALVILSVVALMVSRTPQWEADDTSMQYYARTQVVGSAGLPLLLITVLHTVLAIALPVDTTLPYLLLIGVLFIWYGFRIVTVHVGASIQMANTRRASVQHEERINFVDLIRVPAKQMRENLLNLNDVDAIAQQDAINAIKNVELAVQGFSSSNQASVSRLSEKLSRWATSLEMSLKKVNTLSQKSEKAAFLNEITSSARQMLVSIKSV